MTTSARDDWGFSDADHEELQGLMTRHADRLPELLREVHQYGVKPEPEDSGMAGWLAQTLPDANTRVFPKGGFWWALLDALRSIDAENDDDSRDGHRPAHS